MGFEQETNRSPGSLQRPRASNAKMMFGISSSLKFIFPTLPTLISLQLQNAHYYGYSLSLRGISSRIN